MKLNLYVKQTHTKTGTSGKKFLETQNHHEVWKFQNFTVDGTIYQAQEIRNGKEPGTWDVLCYEMPNPGNPDLLKE